MPNAAGDPDRVLLAQAGPPCLKVRCATQHHRVGEVLTVPGSARLLVWRSRLPQASASWTPTGWPRARPPQTEPAHWTQAGWHIADVVSAEGPEHVSWGCRCTGQPASWATEDLRAAALDRTRREVLLWP